MDKMAKIFVAGHTGLVGSALVRRLTADGYSNIITVTFEELDLTNQATTRAFFDAERPEYIFLAAAKVGGIGANNNQRAQFIYENLAIAMNVIDGAWRSGVTKLCNLGSSCIYPRDAEQPMDEGALLTGPLEPTNEPYAIAKIAAIKLCESYNRQYDTNFISLMPTNLYGPGDNYNLETAHVLPAMIARFDEAKRMGTPEVTLWGDGSPLREFLYVDDLAEAAVFLMNTWDAHRCGAWINVGSGQEVAIGRLANMVRDIVYGNVSTATPSASTIGAHSADLSAGLHSTDEGSPSKRNHLTPLLPAILWDTSHPNGTPRKLLDSTRVNKMGWIATTTLKDGIAAAYAAYLELRH